MSKPKPDPAKKLIKLELPAPLVQLTLQVLAAQAYNVVAPAIELISRQYDRQRKVEAPAPSKKAGRKA